MSEQQAQTGDFSPLRTLHRRQPCFGFFKAALKLQKAGFRSVELARSGPPKRLVLVFQGSF